jgi:putative DNA primase/helicase
MAGPTTTQDAPHTSNGKPGHRHRVAEYDYHDETGNVLFRVVRFEPKDFRQCKPDGNGKWIWNLNGVRRVPYRLPQLLAAKPDEPVYIPEGEKDVWTIDGLGFVGTTCAGGAGKWSTLDAPAVRQAFADRHVCIIPHNDEPGRRHAEDVANRLIGIAADVRILNLPGLPDKGDVSDWVDAGGTAEELRRLTAAAHPRGDSWEEPSRHAEAKNPAGSAPRWPLPVPVSQLSSTGADVEFLLDGCIAKGHLTLLSALMKAGKSTFIGLLLRALQEGSDFIGRRTKKCRTLIVSEESAGLWIRRRDALGLTDALFVMSRPMLAKPSFADWSEFIAFVAEQAAELVCDLIVIDTTSAFAPWKSENDAAEVQGTLTPLNRLTQAGHAVLLVHHIGKADQSEGRAARGSTALAGAADIILELRRYKADNADDRRRVLKGMGRFDEIPTEIVIELAANGSGYTAEGDRKETEARELHAAILDNLPTGDPGKTPNEVHAFLPPENRPTVAAVRKALAEGAKAGHWATAGRGVKGDPMRYWIVES